MEPAVHSRQDQRGEGDDEEVRRDGEDSARLAEAAQVGEGDEADEAHTEGYAMGQELWKRRGEGGHPGGHAHGHGQHVVDQKRGGGHQPRGRAEVGAGHDVGAAARRIRVDGLLIRDGDHHEEAGDGHGHRHGQMGRGHAGQDEHEQDLFRRIRHGGERIGGEDGEGDALREPLVARLGQGHRPPDQPALQQAGVHGRRERGAPRWVRSCRPWARPPWRRSWPRAHPCPS